MSISSPLQRATLKQPWVSTLGKIRCFIVSWGARGGVLCFPRLEARDTAFLLQSRAGIPGHLILPDLSLRPQGLRLFQFLDRQFQVLLHAGILAAILDRGLKRLHRLRIFILH